MPKRNPPPADRYGAPPGRPSRWLVAGVVALAAAFVGWVVWAALGAAEPQVRGEVTGFRVRSEKVIEVRVAAVPGSPGPMACTVRALDRTRGEVGVAGVSLDPAATSQRERWVSVRTRDRAVTATIGACSPLRRGADD